MIAAEIVKELAGQAMEGTGNFLVDVKVNPGNKIIVLLDNEKGVSIDDCVKISKFIEHQLDRDKEDFELQVSSAGLESPFKVFGQYLKNIGKQVEVTTAENQKITGKLVAASEQEISVETSSKSKKENIPSIQTINFNQVKQTKRIISFKF